MAKYNVTYADGSTEHVQHHGSADQLFEQLFSACSDEVRERCSVVKVAKPVAAADTSKKSEPVKPADADKKVDPAPAGAVKK